MGRRGGGSLPPGRSDTAKLHRIGSKSSGDNAGHFSPGCSKTAALRELEQRKASVGSTSRRDRGRQGRRQEVDVRNCTTDGRYHPGSTYPPATRRSLSIEPVPNRKEADAGSASLVAHAYQ